MQQLKGATGLKTRMHSSRMRTGRSLTVCRGGECLQRGVSAIEGVCSWGVSAPRGVSALGGGLLRGGGIPACTEADPPCEQNHTHE